MKKLGLSVVGATALCAALAFGVAACSNSADGNSSAAGGAANGEDLVINAKTLDMRIKKGGKVVKNQNVSQSLVSKTITTGYSDSLFTGTDEVLESEHVKIEKVKNGLKFTIKKPGEDCYDSTKCLREIQKTDANGNPLFTYEYVGQGNGSYNIRFIEVEDGTGNWDDIYEDVGAGNGCYKLVNGEYEYVGQGNGSYTMYFKEVGEGNGNWDDVYDPDENGAYEYTDKEKVYGGWGYTAIYREEMIDGGVIQTTGAQLSNSRDGDVVECFYPLCEPGERYVFKVQIEPSDVNTYRDYQRYEWLVVNALGGIGDIDYSNINSERHCDLSYNGTKPTVKTINCIAPNAKNVKTLVEFFVTDSTDVNAIDWETSNATMWFNEFQGKSKDDNNIDTENIWTDFGIGSFKDMLANTGKSRMFAEYYYSFEVNAASGISSWRTAGVTSQIVSFR